MSINVLGIDIAKNTFQLHGTDDAGKTVLKKRLSRNQLAAYVANLPQCNIVMESGTAKLTTVRRQYSDEYSEQIV